MLKLLTPFLVLAAAGNALAQTAVRPSEASKLPPAARNMTPVIDDLEGIGLDFLDLYVDARTLPLGPFLGFDRNNRLTNTVYMVPIAEMEAHKTWRLPVPQTAPVDHVDFAYNAGHAGVQEPHYHFLLWHVSKAEQDADASLSPQHHPAAAAPAASSDLASLPGNLKAISRLTKLPDFIPALGTLYVDPKTLPVGPYYGYDREGRHVNTIYMLPAKDMNDKKRWTGLSDTSEPIDHTDIYPVPGHPAVPGPHYHVVQWHISRAEQAQLKGDAITAAASPSGGLAKEPPPAPYQRAGELVLSNGASLIPGARQIYVDPAKPVGPYLAYARNGQLVATVFMLPLADVTAHKRYGNLPASGMRVDHVDLDFNTGHYGMPQPHYHVVLWHIDRKTAASLTR